MKAAAAAAAEGGVRSVNYFFFGKEISAGFLPHTGNACLQSSKKHLAIEHKRPVHYLAKGEFAKSMATPSLSTRHQQYED